MSLYKEQLARFEEIGLFALDEVEPGLADKALVLLVQASEDNNAVLELKQILDGVIEGDKTSV